MEIFRGQGATEYLVLLAVVLIVALVSVALLVAVRDALDQLGLVLGDILGDSCTAFRFGAGLRLGRTSYQNEGRTRRQYCGE